MISGSLARRQASCQVVSQVLLQVLSQVMEDRLHQRESVTGKLNPKSRGIMRERLIIKISWIIISFILCHSGITALILCVLVEMGLTFCRASQKTSGRRKHCRRKDLRCSAGYLHFLLHCMVSSLEERPVRVSLHVHCSESKHKASK